MNQPDVQISTIGEMNCDPERFAQGGRIMVQKINRRVLGYLGGKITDNNGNELTESAISERLSQAIPIFQKLFFSHESLTADEIDSIFSLISSKTIQEELNGLFSALYLHAKEHTKPYDSAGVEISTQGIKTSNANIGGKVSMAQFMNDLYLRLRENRGMFEYISREKQINGLVETPVGLYSQEGGLLQEYSYGLNNSDKVSIMQSKVFIYGGNTLHMLKYPHESNSDRDILFFGNGSPVFLRFQVLKRDGRVTRVMRPYLFSLDKGVTLYFEPTYDDKGFITGKVKMDVIDGSLSILTNGFFSRSNNNIRGSLVTGEDQ